MLTQNDLKAIENLLSPIKKTLDDHSKGLRKELTMLGRLQKNFDIFTKQFDFYLQEARRKIDRLEDHLKLPPIS